MSTERITPFKDQLKVKLKEVQDGETEEVFHCDEEAHFLKPELGYGYNPLSLGQRISAEQMVGTYEIVRKLGFGGHSTVWLAKYSPLLSDSTTKTRFMAIKVLTVNFTTGCIYGQVFEIDSMQRITRANPKHPGYEHCLAMRDGFVSMSYHGPHLTIATDVLGSDTMNLQLRQPNSTFSVHVTKRIIKQILLALDYLHRDCGLVHRDLKPQNVMVCMNASDATIAKYLDENPATLYEPRYEPDLSPDPIITVRSQPLPDFGLDPSLDNIIVKLADYGENLPRIAIPLDKIVPGELCQPVMLRAPEVILGHTWSTPIDIWSVGCIVFEYLTGAPMFRLYESPSVSVTDSHLQRITEHVGPFPPSFLARCSRRGEYFDEHGELLRVKNERLIPQPIEDCLATYKHVDKNIITPAAAFIRRCLTIDPAARPSASDLLQDQWLRDVE
ncbi:kinase-like domain-containing protein [Lyophyllum atratum]|nr:kinase-like domain-containing protein [Lyophyllum atratum]